MASSRAPSQRTPAAAPEACLTSDAASASGPLVFHSIRDLFQMRGRHACQPPSPWFRREFFSPFVLEEVRSGHQEPVSSSRTAAETAAAPGWQAARRDGVRWRPRCRFVKRAVEGPRDGGPLVCPQSPPGGRILEVVEAIVSTTPAKTLDDRKKTDGA